MVAAGLEFESIRGYDEQIADFGAEYGGSGDSPGALDSWGLLLVILGSLGITVGAGLLVLERVGERAPDGG